MQVALALALSLSLCGVQVSLSLSLWCVQVAQSLSLSPGYAGGTVTVTRVSSGTVAVTVTVTGVCKWHCHCHQGEQVALSQSPSLSPGWPVLPWLPCAPLMTCTLWGDRGRSVLAASCTCWTENTDADFLFSVLLENLVFNIHLTRQKEEKRDF